MSALELNYAVAFHLDGIARTECCSRRDGLSLVSLLNTEDQADTPRDARAGSVHQRRQDQRDRPAFALFVGGRRIG